MFSARQLKETTSGLFSAPDDANLLFTTADVMLKISAPNSIFLAFFCIEILRKGQKGINLDRKWTKLKENLQKRLKNRQEIRKGQYSTKKNYFRTAVIQPVCLY